MIRAAVLGLGVTILAVPLASGQEIENPFAVIDPLDRETFEDDQLAIGSDEPLTASTALGIERELAALGYGPGAVDGVIDLDTREAIRAFQADEGRRPTGEPSVELYRRLRQTAVAPGQGTVPVDAWRRDLVGKPVHGSGTGEVGRVEDLVVAPDGRVAGVVVAVGAQHVTVPWDWVDHQVGRPTVVLPWTRADLDWLLARRPP